MDYKKVLRLRFVNRLSCREIAESCGDCGKTSVNEFLKRFDACPELTYPLSEDVTNEYIEGFAAATGYTNIQIHLVESGKVKPSDKFLHKVASVFSIRLEWLMTGHGDREDVLEDKIDDKLISWLNEHPEIIRELRMRSGLD